jgi:hypothetical protein
MEVQAALLAYGIHASEMSGDVRCRGKVIATPTFPVLVVAARILGNYEREDGDLREGIV